MSTRIPALRRLAPAALVLCSTSLHAQTAPATDALAKLVPEGTAIYLQAPSLDRLGEVAGRMVKIFGSEEAKAFQIDDMLASMDLPGSAKEIDHQKPIAFCLVLPAEAGSNPFPTFIVPATSPEDFVRSLSGAHTKVTTAIEGSYVSVSESTGAKRGPAPAPIALALPAGDLVARIDVKRLVDHFRPMIEMGLGQVEMAMESAPPKATGGMDMTSFTKMYMEGVRSFIDSGQSLDLAVRLDGDRLEIASDMTMIEKSALAGFGSKEKTDVRSLARFVDPEASITMLVGFDQVALLKQFKPILGALTTVYPASLRPGFEKMMESADEFAVEMGSAMCFSGDIGENGMRFVNYLHPRDPVKLIALYRKMMSSFPCTSLDEPKDGEVDGLRVTSTRLHVDTKAFLEAYGKDLPGKSDAELKAMLDKMYGKDGLALTFATKGDVTAIVFGGDDGFLRTALGRISRSGKPTPGFVRALAQNGDMNPCFALQYNLGKMMQGFKSLMGDELKDMSLSLPSISSTFLYAGGIDGRVWRGSMSTDLAELGAAVRAMKGSSAVQTKKASGDGR